MIRSSLLGEIVSEEQSEWFEKNISENIWRLENPFSIRFFELERKLFTKDFLSELFKVYKLDLPAKSNSISTINLKRIFFKKKLKSPHRSFLDVYYLFRLGDVSISYFNEVY